MEGGREGESDEDKGLTDFLTAYTVSCSRGYFLF